MPRSERHIRPLDAAALHALAIRYVGRYATTRAKLTTYLIRKIGERGWADEGASPVDTIVERCVAAGYVDDQAFAEAKTRSLSRRGYGHRRVAAALHSSGIAREVSDALRPDADSAFVSAEIYARKRKIGRFAAAQPDRKLAQRHFAAMLRAGHSAELARYFSSAVPAMDVDEFI